MTEIHDRETILLGDRIMVLFNHDEKTDSWEAVVHPGVSGGLSVRTAKEPYECDLYLADGEVKRVNLADSDDWGNIQDCIPGDCNDWKNALGYGDDANGHRTIKKVTYPDGEVIPLEQFRRDCGDFLPYHEG